MLNEIIKSGNIKGYRKTHLFEIKKTTISGHITYTVSKNGNTILNCKPKEFKKFLALFS